MAPGGAVSPGGPPCGTAPRPAPEAANAKMDSVTAIRLDGKATLATVKEELRIRVAALAERGIVPGLGTVLIGDDPGSHTYVAFKHRDCADVGIASIRVDLPAGTTQA